MRSTAALLILALSLPAKAAMDPAPLLEQAQEAYANGDHARALALYDSVNTEFTSAALLYNIGNCHSKLGDMPHAILYYERALRLAPGAEDIQANLDLERSKVVDRINQLPGFTLGSAWDSAIGGKDVDQWARRSLWACALMALAGAGAIVLRNKVAKRSLAIMATLALAGTIISVALAAHRVQEVERKAEAIILAPSVEILGEPRKGSTRLFILHQGSKVGLLEEQGEWQEVRLPNGSVGWLPVASIAKI
ncbi:MAG TPA: tetratricopeptide repeat protein [Flavobacteriales bacterium]|nr:tetratricopeptide repeat protein [Flavobacteriales bacterium]